MSTFVIISCTKYRAENNISANSTQTDQPISSDEEKAVETFNHFMEMLNKNGDPQTRAATPEARIVSVRKTSAATYGGATQTRAGDDKGLVTYELTLENPDNTQGFAVVADPALVDQVIAYAPVGSIADTVYNEGLAMYFRELAMLSEIISRKAATRADVWQSGWESKFNKRVSEYEFIKWLTPEESQAMNSLRPGGPGTSIWYCNPVDKMEITSAYVPTLWGQKDPYNICVPVYVNGYSTTRSKVGCYAVAVGQIMAYHKYPPQYPTVFPSSWYGYYDPPWRGDNINWNLLTQSPTVSSKRIIWYGENYATCPGNTVAIETAAQWEVSQLLYSIARAGQTEFRAYVTPYGAGATHFSMTVEGLNTMGYDANDIKYDGEPISAQVVREELQNHRPVLVAAQGYLGIDLDNITGHIWVIDGTFAQERWEYMSFVQYGGEYNGKEGLNRYRVQGNLAHCNWGWDGSSNGWYYCFWPFYEETNEGLMLSFNKHLYTGIKPKQ